MSEPDDRLQPTPPSEEPAPEPADEFRPPAIPDIRKKVSPLRRLLVLAVAAALIAGGVWAVYRWRQHDRIEQTVRRGFEAQLHQGVASVRLSRLAGGRYRGTLTTTAGEEWAVTASVRDVGGGRQVRWKARPPLARAKADLRADLEKALNRRVKSLELTQNEDGAYSGQATLESGEQFDILENEDENAAQLFRYEWARPTIEHYVREQARMAQNDQLASLTLTRLGPARYSGQAVGESGLTYLVFVDPQREDGKVRGRLRLHPPPEQYGRWVKRGLEAALGAKARSVEMKARPEGDHAGQAVLATGEVYDVRAGTPPAWRGTPADGEVIWRAALAPSSYETWLRNGLQDRYKVKLKSVKLKRLSGGEYAGTARAEDGRRFEVRVGPLEKDRKQAKKLEWPDLGPDPVAWEAIPVP